MPGEFARPSFFLDLVAASEEDLCRDYYLAAMTWQIVYFAPRSNAGYAETFNQVEVAGRLKKTLMDSMVILGPSGVMYHIENLEGGPRESEVYITVRITAEVVRHSKQHEIAEELHHEMRGV